MGYKNGRSLISIGSSLHAMGNCAFLYTVWQESGNFVSVVCLKVNGILIFLPDKFPKIQVLSTPIGNTPKKSSIESFVVSYWELTGGTAGAQKHCNKLLGLVTSAKAFGHLSRYLTNNSTLAASNFNWTVFGLSIFWMDICQKIHTHAWHSTKPIACSRCNCKMCEIYTN